MSSIPAKTQDQEKTKHGERKWHCQIQDGEKENCIVKKDPTEQRETLNTSHRPPAAPPRLRETSAAVRMPTPRLLHLSSDRIQTSRTIHLLLLLCRRLPLLVLLVLLQRLLALVLLVLLLVLLMMLL
jgi:hypothetical protein